MEGKIKNGGKFINYGTKIFAGIGLVAVLLFGGFGLSRVAPDILNSIASVAVSLSSQFFPAEEIIVTVNPVSVNSGEEAEVSFERDSSDDGSYAFFYECRSGTHLEYEGEVVFCDTSYNFSGESNPLRFKAFSGESASVSLPIEIRFIKEGDDEASSSGKGRIIIAGRGEEENRGSTNGTDSNGGVFSLSPGRRTDSTFIFSATSTGANPSSPTGRPDLETRIIETGYVNRDSNIFTATSSVKANDRAAVKFEVKNAGNKTSDSWAFNAVLPTFPSYIHHSESQIPLAPGERIEFIIGFDSIMAGEENEVVFVANADPTNSIRESNEDNNIARVKIRVIKSQ